MFSYDDENRRVRNQIRRLLRDASRPALVNAWWLAKARAAQIGSDAPLAGGGIAVWCRKEEMLGLAGRQNEMFEFASVRDVLAGYLDLEG